MLRLYRSNRAEFLAALLARQLLDNPPGPLETVEVLVNTWPTSRWLGEQLAQANGISSLVRFPFPGSHLRQLVRQVLGLPEQEDDPWRATVLVWTVLDLLPELLEQPQAASLRLWLEQRDASTSGLTRDRWQLARVIADALDDYALYRPAVLQEWQRQPLTSEQDWQPLLFRQLVERLPSQPFGLQVCRAVERLRLGLVDPAVLPPTLRLFGISALAPVQVELIQALSGSIDVQIYLLTPCRDLWQRCGSRRQGLGDAWNQPPDGAWLQEAPRLEACLGRMGAEFQQLLEGSGESQLGEVREGDLFADPRGIAAGLDRDPTLLEQLQQQLVAPDQAEPIARSADDTSLLFQAAPGPWREVQLVRDRILQWLEADPQLTPRDVLVMTPNIDRYAPLLASVFNDVDATGVELPWRLTDRSQQSSPGLTMAMLDLLQLAADRLTASGLERLLANPALQRQQGLNADDAAAVTRSLQRSGFRWGLDACERGGDETHSLHWTLDRWLLGLVLPQRDGLAPGGVAPFHDDLDPQRLVRWWSVLDCLQRWLQRLRNPQPCMAWVALMQRLLEELFGDGGDWSWERQCWSSALEDWQRRAGDCDLALDVAVAAEVLREALSVDSGRFGHRSGALTVSALEPMRAIPHKVIVLMGLDGQDFPRHSNRPGFHLLEQQRQLGDPRSSDQDRYVLLEALMSARQHLMISWCGRNERTGEGEPAAAPVEQWLADLQRQLGDAGTQGLCLEPAPNPLDRSNFRSGPHGSALSCDRRQLAARRWLDRQRRPAQQGLALPLAWSPPDRAVGQAPLSVAALQRWLMHPQEAWLRQLGLHAGEGIDAVEDLEDLELDALQRHQLLVKELEAQLPDQPIPSWRELLAGQGVLPAGAGGQLEEQDLQQRWQSLQRCVEQLGPCRRSGSWLFAGDTQVVLHPGKLSARSVMLGWLQHLLLCAEGEALSGTAVIARQSRGDGAEIHLHWRRLDRDTAREELDQLQCLALDGLKRCWPVPVNSGWLRSWHEHRKPGSGDAQFRSSWEIERQKAPFQLCFGRDVDAEMLLQVPGFDAACEALYRPLFQGLLRG